MSKELEAFNKIKFALDFIYCGELSKEKEIVQYLDIIETALKRLENYEQNEDFNKDVLNYAFLNEQDKIKKLKALEIIKETLEIDLYYSDFEQKYLIVIGNLVAYALKGKEEYDLLKEVLPCD